MTVTAVLSAIAGAVVSAFVAHLLKVAVPEERANRLTKRLIAAVRQRYWFLVGAGATIGVACFVLLSSGQSGRPEQIAVKGRVVTSIAGPSPIVQAPPEARRCARARPVSARSSLVPNTTATSVLVGNNPIPAEGLPHGRGISHRDFPNGYELDGEPRPAFNNYIDYSDGSPNDERPFLGARVRRPDPCPVDSFETRKKIRVVPGDVVSVSIFIHNNGGSSHNLDGEGPAVARNTRIAVDLPPEPDIELQMSAWLFARNAIVDERNLRLHTISDNLSFLSRSGWPIELRFIRGSGKLLQSLQWRADLRREYQAWELTPMQERWLRSGERRAVDGHWELQPDSGLPVGNDGTLDPTDLVGGSQVAALDWFGCNTFHGYLQFRLRVARGATIIDG